MITKKRILAILLACVLLCSDLGGQFICCAQGTQQESARAEAEEQEVAEMLTTEELTTEELATEEVTAEMPATDSQIPATEVPVPDTMEPVDIEGAEEEEEISYVEAEASGYKTTKHLLSDGANAKTSDGTAAYSNIKDSKVTVAAIKKKGGKYAKCTAETKKKGKEEKEYFYKITYENKVGDFVTNGYYDNKKQHHGAVHLVEKCYKKYQNYSQIYSYSVKDDKKKTIDYYYFIFIWRELTDGSYHKASEKDYLTYCLEYGTAISKTDAAYVKEEKQYQALSETEKYKVACAIYYGPHRALDGTYYLDYNSKLSTSKGYDPATWSKKLWLYYAATQFYIWTVSSPERFSHADAVATAKKLDKDYTSTSASCLDFYRAVKQYAETATKLPSFLSSDRATVKTKNMTRGADGVYRVVLTDKRALASAGTWSCDNPSVQITVDSGKKLTLTSLTPIDSAVLTYQKTMPVPDGNGMLYYADAKSQNMVNALVTSMPIYGYVALRTKDIDDSPIQIQKLGDRSQKPYAGAGYAIFTADANAAVYDPVTEKTMTLSDGTAVRAQDYFAGYVYQNPKTAVWEFVSGQAASVLQMAGYVLTPVYHIAYYVKQGKVSSVLPSTYCITSDADGYAVSGNMLRKRIVGNAVTYSDYYVVEYQAPQHCDLAYPVQISNGVLVQGSCCLQWNQGEERIAEIVEQTDKEHPGALRVYKYEAGSIRPLKNVVFHLYEDADCTSLVRELVTGEDGIAYADELPGGIYYLVEYQGQSIHILEKGITEIKIEPDALTTVDKSNVPIAIQLYLQKQVDWSSLPAYADKSLYSVKGAEYTVYAAEDIYGANQELLYAKDAEVYTIVCDEQGYGEVPETFAREKLRMGKYYVKETKAPNGLLLDQNRYEIDASSPECLSEYLELQGDEYTYDQELYAVPVRIAPESIVQKPIQIQKTGLGITTKGENCINPLAEAEFSVYAVHLLQEAGATPDKEKLEQIPFSAYETCRITISEAQEHPYTVITDAKGLAKTIPLPYGSYILVETKAPQGYEKRAPQWIEVNGESADDAYVLAEVENQMQTGKIEITKYADYPAGISTAQTEYGVWNQILFGQKTISGVVFGIYDEQMQKLQEIKTNQDGVARSTELPCGTYYVQELYTRNGLVRDETCHKVRIEPGETDKEGKAEKTMYNACMETSLIIQKSGEAVETSKTDAFQYTTKALAGAVFGIYNSAPLVENGTVLLEQDSLLGIAVSDEQGQAVFSGKLLPGDYYYHEIKAPEGYRPDTQRRSFTLSLESQKEQETICLNPQTPMVNRYYSAALRLQKIDGANPAQGLGGVVFALYDAKTNQQVGQYVTDENGEIKIERMPYGTWYFKETKPLAGYQVDTQTYSFTVDETETPVTLVVTNYPNVELGFLNETGTGRYWLLLFLGVLCMLAGVAGMYVNTSREYRVCYQSTQYMRALQEGKKTKADEDAAAKRSDVSRKETKKEREAFRKRKETADYEGEIDCLLSIPKINMNRLVITGGDVEYNLSRHYFAAARTHMHYGEGSYVIFGHQSFTKNKGMNRLGELTEGDVIYIIGKDYEDTYEVTEILTSKEGERMTDFAGDETCLAIYTCKKQHERPKPYLIVRAKKRV